MYTDTDRYTDRSITNTDITEDRCTQTLIDIQIDLLQTQTLQKIDVYDRQTDRYIRYITNTDITVDICTLTDRQIDLLQTTQTFQKIGVHRQIDKQIYYKHRHYRRQMYADRQTDRSIRNKDMTVDIYIHYQIDRQIYYNTDITVDMPSLQIDRYTYCKYRKTDTPIANMDRQIDM